MVTFDDFVIFELAKFSRKFSESTERFPVQFGGDYDRDRIVGNSALLEHMQKVDNTESPFIVLLPLSPFGLHTHWFPYAP